MERCRKLRVVEDASFASEGRVQPRPKRGRRTDEIGALLVSNARKQPHHLALLNG
jgi:hypothetical protein